MPENSLSKYSPGAVCLPFVTGVNALTAALTIGIFLPVANDTRIRPMGWAGMILMIGFLNVAAGAFLLLLDISRKRVRFVYILMSFVLTISPIPLALGVWHLLVVTKGLIVSD